MAGMILVGMDEVGRGSWAGPLAVGAVALSEPVPGLRDSKCLSRSARERLALSIEAAALTWAIGWADPAEIDQVGLTAALCLAYQRALAGLVLVPDRIIIDGGYNFLPKDRRVQTRVRADATVPAVSAASIIAKVARDDFMRSAAQTYPEYGFESHVGYGTARHRAALEAQGICRLHRRSFRPVRLATEGRATI